MKLEALDHPKTLDFAARLGVELPTAIGHLELLWAFTGKKAPQGNIGKWPDGAIARACFWNGEPAFFISALVDAGYLDADQQSRYMIHDWMEHAPRWVKAKLKNLNLEFITVVATTGPTVTDTTGPTVNTVCKGSEVKGSTSEGKSKIADADASAPSPEADMPPGLDITAWVRWIEYRKQIRKPLKPVSIPAAQQELAAFGCDQAAVVQQSIANGYQGLFAPKINGGHNAKPSKLQQAAAAIRASHLHRATDVQDVGEEPRLRAISSRLASGNPSDD